MMMKVLMFIGTLIYGMLYLQTGHGMLQLQYWDSPCKTIWTTE